VRLEGELLDKVVNAVERIPFGKVSITIYCGQITSIETQETRRIVQKRGDDR
jgi:hypothetical protein